MDNDSELLVVSSVVELAGDGCPGNYVLSIATPLSGREVNVSLSGGGLTASGCGTDWQWVRKSDGQLFNFNNGTFNFDASIGVQPISRFFCRSTVPFSIEIIVIL